MYFNGVWVFLRNKMQSKDENCFFDIEHFLLTQVNDEITSSGS